MKKYCVATANPYSGDLTQKIVTATSDFEAVVTVLGLDPTDYDGLDAIEDMLAHCGDVMVNVIEL